jgi:transposase
MDAPTPEPVTLPDDVPTLQRMVRELLTTVAELRRTVEAQQVRIDELTRRIYGRKSERVTPDPNTPAASAADPVPLGPPTAAPVRCRGHGRRPLPEHLPRQRVEHDLAEAEKPCPCCGRPRQRIGTEVSEQLDYHPASLFVVEHVRHTYACAACSRTRDPIDGVTPTIATAPLPPQPIGKGLPGPGLLAHVVTSKYADHLPLARLEGILARHAVALNRSTLGGWVRACAVLLGPLANRMAALVRASKAIQTDDTPVPLLRGPGKAGTAYLWAYLGDTQNPYTVFDFTATHAGVGPKTWLGDYAGFVQADALKQYDPLFDRPPPRPTEVGCWAHARRKFHDARASDSTRAHEALARIRSLYEIEAEAKSLDEAGRLALRQQRSRPALDALFAWMEEQRPKVLPKSPLGGAIGYALGNRGALSRYAEAGFLEIDNNACERALRGIAVGRGNWTFVGSESGGETAAVLYSVVGSCRRLGLDPWAYLRDVLTRLPTLPAEWLDELLPDRWARERDTPIA